MAFTSISDSTTVKVVPPQTGQAAECSGILLIHNEGSGRPSKTLASYRWQSKQRATPPLKPPPWPHAVPASPGVGAGCCCPAWRDARA